MDFLRPEGRLHIEFFEPGEPVRTLHASNSVVLGGLRWMASKLSGGYATTIGSIAIGRGTRETVPGDIYMQAETARQTLTSTHTTETVADGPSAAFVTTFGGGVGTGNLTELGLFLHDGTLVARAVIPQQFKGETTSMRIKWSITLKP